MIVSTHVRIDKKVVPLLDELCGYTGESRPETLRRIIVFAKKERECFVQKKRYQSLLKEWGEPALKAVTR